MGDHSGLRENLGGFADVTLLPGTFVSADSIGHVLREHGCPIAPDFVKIDIDGQDASVLGALLAEGFRPLALQVEVNPEIPPPYCFSILPSEHYLPGFGAGFFGMSLQYAVDLVQPFGYALVDLDFETECTHDALFVSHAVLDRIPDLEQIDARTACLARPPLLPHIPGASREVKESWRHRPDDDGALREIEAAFADASQRKLGHIRAPFTVYRHDTR